MCGIAGYLGPRGPDLQAIGDALARSMAHRGPDHEGRRTFELRGARDRVLLLVHRRLSILDLSPLGHQPMHDPETGNWIVYNGEVYNFKEIARALEQRGARFRSRSDTEVILKGYALKGRAILDDLSGMFAFALWDAAREELFLAVDPVGIKPLYYWIGPRGELLFASELRALLSTGLIPRTVDPVGLEGYLSYGAVQAPNTFIAGARAFLPGTCLAVPAGGTIGEPEPYWKPPFPEENESAPVGEKLAGEIGDLLETVVRQHLVSDVPVGAFLSGGIDSSAIVALASRHSRDLQTFSVTFKEEEFSEAPYSREIARLYSPRHTELCLSESDLLQHLPDALDAMDQPTLDGMNVYIISRAVRQAGITVVLSGQGGDEVFGGYPTFQQVPQALRWRRRLGLVPGPGWRLLGRIWNAARARRRAMPDKIGQFLAGGGEGFGTYLLLRQLFPPAVRRSLFPAGGGGASPEGLPIAAAAALQEAAASLDPVNLVSFLELRTYLANMLLRDGDFMSMAHSLEVRVPFLDRRVVEHVARLPGTWKVGRSLPKPLLLQALRDRLPPMIYRRQKQGFTFPWPRWLRQELRPLAEGALSDRQAYADLGLDPEAVGKLWRSFLAGAPGLSWSRIWSLIVLREWARRQRAKL